MQLCVGEVCALQLRADEQRVPQLRPDAFEDPAVDGDAVFTQGISAHRTREFFGARQTRAEERVGTPGDPLLPRAGGITVMATYRLRQ